MARERTGRDGRGAGSGSPSVEPPAPGGSAPIPVPECWRLSATVPFGRMVFTEAALPAVHPVDFAVSEYAVVIRTGPGPKFDAARRGDVVAFEADAIDAETHTGWSVLVIGHSSVVTDIDRLVGVVDVDHRPWVRGPGRHVIQITGEQVTGRRVSLETDRTATTA